MLRTALPAVCLLLFVTADSGYTQDVILEPLASGLSSPVYMTTARDGTDRRFIVEQQGRAQFGVEHGEPLRNEFCRLAQNCLGIACTCDHFP